ncbi:MAG: DUF2142 domain-containing protein [Cryobacterium sp.]|nr:DUF2142 domain-containing protein [Cryobacterium sp.]
MGANQPRRRIQRILAAITSAFVATMLLWAALTPLFGAPDEAAHFSSAYRLATAPAWPDPGDARVPDTVRKAMEIGGKGRADDRLTWSELSAAPPIAGDSVDWMTQHPPLYYAIAGSALAVTDLDNARWDQSILTLRFLSIALLAPLPTLLYFTTTTLTRSRRAGLASAASPLVIPQLPFIGAAVSNDPMVITGAAFATWMIARIITGRRDNRTLVLLGLTIAVLALTKGTGLTIVPLALVALLVFPTPLLTVGRRLRDVILVMGVASLGLWWWVWNVIRFGTVQPSGTRSIRPEIPWPADDGPDRAVWLNGLWNGVTQSFWGNFGGLSIPMFSAITEILSVGFLLLVAFWAYRAGTRRVSVVLSVHALTILVLLAQTVWSVYNRTQFIYGVQGRYFFVALASLSALAAIASLTSVRQRVGRQRAFRAIGIAAPLLTAYALAISFAGFYQEEAGGFSVTPESLVIWAAVTPMGVVGLALSALAVLITFGWVTVEFWRSWPTTVVQAGGPDGNTAANADVTSTNV